MILTVLVNICLQKNLQLTTEILSYVCFFIVVNNYIPVLAYVILLIAGSPCKRNVLIVVTRRFYTVMYRTMKIEQCSVYQLY